MNNFIILQNIFAMHTHFNSRITKTAAQMKLLPNKATSTARVMVMIVGCSKPVSGNECLDNGRVYTRTI